MVFMAILTILIMDRSDLKTVFFPKLSNQSKKISGMVSGIGNEPGVSLNLIKHHTLFIKAKDFKNEKILLHTK
jgi:hypothetical protein